MIASLVNDSGGRYSLRPEAPMRVQVLDYVVLIVSDLERALAFYTRTLGLELQHRAEKYAQMKAGTTRLALYTRDAMAETLGTTATRRSRSWWPPARPRWSRRRRARGGSGRRTCETPTGT
jgi:catechol 2,3-dioxygenase-like lactoylglutathione lyase family enzyme